MLVAALAGCTYHFPFERKGDRTPLGRARDEERVARPLWQTAAGFVASAALTLAIHEGAHALAAEVMGADDVKVAFFHDGKVGITTFEGGLSQSERNFVDLAGPVANWLVGEGLEWALARDKVPQSWRPWLAQWALVAKADAYVAVLDGVRSDEADLGAVADRSEFAPGWWLVPAAADGVTHHRLYPDLWREATTQPAPPRPDAAKKEE
jgi:hypothetical protein